MHPAREIEWPKLGKEPSKKNPQDKSDLISTRGFEGLYRVLGYITNESRVPALLSVTVLS